MMSGLRMAVGTLTAIPVRRSIEVTRPVARAAMLLAPLAVLPLGLLVAGIGWAGRAVGLPPLVSAVLAVGAAALGCRGLHLDGLADTADGLAASYRRDRALAVMRSGDTGPAGLATTVLVLLAQVAALAAVLGRPWGPLLAGVCWCVSRAALALACRSGVPAARTEGLGAAVAGTVPAVAVIGLWLGGLAALSGAGAIAGHPWWQGLLVGALAGLAVLVVLRRCVSRVGGITGDVLGAVVEICLAVLLVGLSAR